MQPSISRRDFLKLGSLSFGALALRPLSSPWPPEEFRMPRLAARVTVYQVNVHAEPRSRSEVTGKYLRDTIVRLEEELDSPHGPARNNRWYRVEGGYAHSAYLQRVEKAHLNVPLEWVPNTGLLGEVTVPYVQSLRLTRTFGWKRLYRLYYGSVYWITGLTEGPDSTPWYELTDDLLHVKYCVPANTMRPIAPEELAPISPEVPDSEKSIFVSLADQTLTAFEGDTEVYHTKVSTGLPTTGTPSSDQLPTDTPDGAFRIQVKLPSRHMGDGKLTDSLEAYELPGVPWVSFFHRAGIAFHGTYWHDNFGRRMSHGCVNMRNEDALWLYRWSNPTALPSDWNRKGNGTLIRIK